MHLTQHVPYPLQHCSTADWCGGGWCVVLLLQTGCRALQYLGKTSRKQNSQDTAWKQTPAPARGRQVLEAGSCIECAVCDAELSCAGL